MQVNSGIATQTQTRKMDGSGGGQGQGRMREIMFCRYSFCLCVNCS